MKQSPPDKYRVRGNSIVASDASYGNNGFFILPHYKIAGYVFNCQVSDGMGWEHVSVTVSNTIGKKKVDRCPTWEEMCYIKDMFWNEDECVVQYHPPKSEYVSFAHNCLHLWKPTDSEIPVPQSILVGPASALKK